MTKPTSVGVIESGGRLLRRSELIERAARAAAGFAALGLKEGDCVALCLRNDFPVFEASFGAALIGAYSVPVNWHFTVEEARYIFENSSACVILIHADLVHRLQGAFPPGITLLVAETPPEILQAYGLGAAEGAVPSGMTDWALWRDSHKSLPCDTLPLPRTIIYTSGTTGRPKGVRFAPPTPSQLEIRLRVAQRGFGFLDYLDEPERIIAVLTGPLYHSAPSGYAMQAVWLGATLILQPRFDAVDLLRLIEARGITHIHMVPVMFHRLLGLPEHVRKAHDISSLRFVVHAAAPCPVAIKRAMIDWWGLVIHEYYGGTETGIVTSCTPEQWLEHPGTVGCPVPEAQVRVIDSEGRDRPPGLAGEIVCRIWGMADFTYHADPEKRREVDHDGLIGLGDIGYFDADDFLHVCDRSRDMVISGGVNIYPAEIEAELARMPGVVDCAVFGIPDAEFGEAICAVIQPRETVAMDAEHVREFLARGLASYKLPRRIEFRNELPREDSGKIFKRKLREPYWKKAGRQI